MTAIVDRRQILDFRLAGHNLSLPAASLGVAAGACGLQDTPPGSAAQGLHAWVPDASPDDVDGAIAETKELIVVWSRRGSSHLVPTEDLTVFTLGLMPTTEEGWRSAIAGFVAILDRHGMSATEIVRLTVEAVHDALDGRELTKRALGSALRPHMPTALQPWFDDQTFSEFTAVLTRAASLTGDLCVTPRRGNEATFALTDQWLGHVRPEADPAVQRLELLRRFLRCSHRRRSMTSPPGPASR